MTSNSNRNVPAECTKRNRLAGVGKRGVPSFRYFTPGVDDCRRRLIATRGCLAVYVGAVRYPFEERSEESSPSGFFDWLRSGREIYFLCVCKHPSIK